MLSSVLPCIALLVYSHVPPSGASAIAASRNPIVAGDPVTLSWFITGDKVVLSGGKFGKGTIVTGHTSATDRPAANTAYALEVWYRDNAGKPLHARYTQAVEVLNPDLLGLQKYQDSRGWRLLHPKQWKCDKVSEPDPARNALMYFQEEEDSLERLAVAILPVSEQSCATLMKKIELDLPSHYDDLEVVSRQEITFENVPAFLSVVSGKDHTHFGARTRSIILVFVRSGLGYIISGRTPEDKFMAKQPLLTKLVKSFAFVAPARVSDRSGK